LLSGTIPLPEGKGVPLHRLIGASKRRQIPAYASVLRIGIPELVAGAANSHHWSLGTFCAKTMLDRSIRRCSR
jgi:L-alanine-DL-glutamate epimerase-like enolase superfamily enzyme